LDGEQGRPAREEAGDRLVIAELDESAARNRGASQPPSD
jgi:hypothetical protein